MLANHCSEFIAHPNTRTDILIRILQKATVLYLSDAPDELLRALHMIPVHSLEESLKKVEDLLQNPQASITVIPDGVSVMVTNQE